MSVWSVSFKKIKGHIYFQCKCDKISDFTHYRNTEIFCCIFGIKIF